jgi:hypothetical protein
MLGWAQFGFHKKHAGTLCSCIWWDRRVTQCIPVRPGHETSMLYFLYSGGTSECNAKSVLGHVTPNLYFLHTVGSVGHVVHSGAFGA